ncbi:hypothetical protein AJ78_01885 [Emergomyces pasteurianus Ep9510]|uniref:Uncharacterized protein n=1 Tax=Emergomyces pasteurianus Ep9510 TaxID=1447872 RepID=A0A1J9QPF5_9EURO|nr:hypothetical protein AJ78_01885 [Emergomyces pasteurianus Ep9510]
MQRTDCSFSRPGVPGPTVPMGRSRDEVLVVDKSISTPPPDKRPVTRRGPTRDAGENPNYEDLSKCGPRPSTAVISQANCANTFDLMKFLDDQNEPMHRSAPYQMVVNLVASGRKRLRLLDDSKSNVRRKSNAVVKDDNHHLQTEKPKSRLWNSMSNTKKKRVWSGMAEIQTVVHNDEQVALPQRRKWMVPGTRSRKNSKVIECEDHDFLYPGVGKLPPLTAQSGRTPADNINGDMQSSEEPWPSGDACWQLETAHDNDNQTDAKKGVERAEDSTAAPLATVSSSFVKNLGFLALKQTGANGVCDVSTAPNGYNDSSLTLSGGSESSRENNNNLNNNNYNNNKTEGATCQNPRPLQQHPCAGQTAVPGSSDIKPPLTQLQPSDCHLLSNNTGLAPQLPDTSLDLTLKRCYETETKTKTEEQPFCPTPDQAHIDLQYLPPRSSSRGACRSPSIFAGFTHHRRRSSYSKSCDYPLLPRNSTYTQSLISLFPRPARFPDASNSTPASMPSLDPMQPLHAVTTSTPTHFGMASCDRHGKSSKGSPLAASPLNREASPDGKAVQDSVPIACPQTPDNARSTPTQTKRTELQDDFSLTAPGERQFMESNAGRRLNPRGSLESKKLRCLGISDPSKIGTTKSLDKMSRAERVFVLRMRDMCLARGALKKDTQPQLLWGDSTPEEVRRGWELQTACKGAEDNLTDMSIVPPKARRNDAPGSPPSIPLPADPPVPSLRSPSNKIVFGANQLTGLSQSTTSLDTTLVHKAEVRLSASSSGSTHRSNSNKSWSSRSARSGNDIPPQSVATNAEHHTPSSQHKNPAEENIIGPALPSLTPLTLPMSDDARTSILIDCGSCVSCSHLRTNPSPTNKNRKNTFFYKENLSDTRINNGPVSQSPLRECFPQDIPRPYTPSPPSHKNTSTYSNRNSTSNNNTHATSSPQSSSTRPRSQDTSAHPQCEARIAFLERQNKMLQAALIAALDVGVTFDADLMRSVTSTPPISIASPGSDTNHKDTYRQSYASTTTTGTTKTTASTQRLSVDGRRSYIRDRSVEPAANVVRSRSVRDELMRPSVGDSNYQGHEGEKKLACR